MMDMLFVAFFQVAAGDPTAPPAPNTTPAADPAAPAASTAAPTERRRCRRVRTTGSKIAERVCTSERAEGERSDHARDMVDELVRGIDTRQMIDGGIGATPRMPRL